MTFDEALQVVAEQIRILAPHARVGTNQLTGDGKEIEVHGDRPDSFLVIIASSSETVVIAGVRARFELDPLPGDLDDCLQIVEAVLEGRLRETAGPRSSKFELHLANGFVLQGRVSDSWRHPQLRSKQQVVPFPSDR
jgi:hypothetical protein